MGPQKQVQLTGGSTESKRRIGMKAEFWHERWEKNEIGFHQPSFNEHMQAFTGRLGIAAGVHVLVPLCGKSLDMLWLAGQGYRVTGIELSERAARDFFEENALDHEKLRRAGVTVYRGQQIEIWCTDFFELRREDIPRIDAVYDRAALIALPPEMRTVYADHLAGLVRGGVPVLMITLDYPKEEMKGPPFSVTRSEVEDLFSRSFSIQFLKADERLSEEPRFRKKGLTRMDEHVYLMRKI
jgi:thiopurine S-methyltransferase